MGQHRPMALHLKLHLRLLQLLQLNLLQCPKLKGAFLITIKIVFLMIRLMHLATMYGYLMALKIVASPCGEIAQEIYQAPAQENEPRLKVGEVDGTLGALDDVRRCPATST